MIRRLLGFLSILLVLTACAAATPVASGVHVENAYALPTVANQMNEVTGTPDNQGMSGMPGMSLSDSTSAVYFVIVNDTSEVDTLIGASSDAASQTTLHETRMNGDVAEMVPVNSVDIPAHGRFEFKPGGYHVMLVGLTRDLKEGNTFKLSLKFEKNGTITLEVPVRQEK